MAYTGEYIGKNNGLLAKKFLKKARRRLRRMIAKKFDTCPKKVGRGYGD